MDKEDSAKSDHRRLRTLLPVPPARSHGLSATLPPLRKPIAVACEACRGRRGKVLLLAHWCD